MARQARLVLPGLPYHATQRGNRRHPAFFREAVLMNRVCVFALLATITMGIPDREFLGQGTLMTTAAAGGRRAALPSYYSRLPLEFVTILRQCCDNCSR